MPEPVIAGLLAKLAELAARNTASAIGTRVSTARAKGQQEETINELSDIINQLVEDRSQLLGIASALREELVAQQITESDLAYITEKLIPAVEGLLRSVGDDDNEALEPIKALITVELLTTLQLVGFNFKRAIGEPLTEVVEALVLNLVPAGAKKATQSKKRK